MSVPILLRTVGPLSYYYIPGTTAPINIDPRVTAKAFLIGSGEVPSFDVDVGGFSGIASGSGQTGGNAGAIAELELTDRSIYMLNQSGTLSLFNGTSEIAVARSGGGFRGGRGGDRASVIGGSGFDGEGPGGRGGVGAVNNGSPAGSGLGSPGTRGLGGTGYGAGGGGSQGGRIIVINGANVFEDRPLNTSGGVNTGGYGGGGGGGSGFDLQKYANCPDLNSQQSSDSALILAISPGVPPSTSEVSMLGVGLTPVSTQKGKNYYIVKNNSNIRFNTSKAKTVYYIAPGGAGGGSVNGGNGLNGGQVTYFHAGIRYNNTIRRGGTWLNGENDSITFLYYSPQGGVYASGRGPNVHLCGGGAGAGGGGGGGAGGAAKISITSNYLHCMFTAISTDVFTEDKFLGTAGRGGMASGGRTDARMNAYFDGSNPANCMGGNLSTFDYYDVAGSQAGGLGGPGGGRGYVGNAYTGTQIFTPSLGYDGAQGGAGQSQGFKAEQPNGIPPPRVINALAQVGGSSPNTGKGGALYPVASKGQCQILWDGFYAVNQYDGDNDTQPNGRHGDNGVRLPGFGAGHPGGGGRGGFAGTHPPDQQPRPDASGSADRIGNTYALGGGGGGGGNGAPGFSLDAVEGTTGLDAFGDTNGCVIIVVG